VRVAYEDWWLSDTSVLEKLRPNDYKVTAYYMPDVEGKPSEVYIFQGDKYIDTVEKVETYNRVLSEQTEDDMVKYIEQRKKIAKFEKYVREHPSNMLSTVLLVVDYSDFSDHDKVDKLLRGIEIQARPESLTGLLYGNEKDRKRAVLPRLMSLSLFKHGGKFEEIKLTDKTSILSLWANPQNSRNALINKLQTLDKGIRIIDVLTESDSLRWHQTIAGDPADWQHYWAPGGPMEQGIQMLGIKSLPWFAVTDSTGLVVYSGPNCDLASKKASELIR
jgi:hypothetical protein